MTRRSDLDAQVERYVTRSKSAVSASDVANRLEISVMAAMYSLKRLRDAGALLSSVELVDTPARIRTTVTLYQRPGGHSIYPEWMAPTAMPALCRRRLIQGSWA